MSTNEAAERLPQTKHGRYVLNIARLWHWAAFDVNDISQIESESRRVTVERIREAFTEFWSDEAVKQDYAFHPSLLFRILDKEAAR